MGRTSRKQGGYESTYKIELENPIWKRHLTGVGVDSRTLLELILGNCDGEGELDLTRPQLEPNTVTKMQVP